MDRPLLRYMHIFRIMQSFQEKFVSGILHVLIYAFKYRYIEVVAVTMFSIFHFVAIQVTKNSPG